MMRENSWEKVCYFLLQQGRPVATFTMILEESTERDFTFREAFISQWLFFF